MILDYTVKQVHGQRSRKKRVDGYGGVSTFATGTSGKLLLSSRRADCSRLLCLELGQPIMADEETFDVKLPSPIDDRHLREPEHQISESSVHSTSAFLLTIRITKGISSIIRMLKQPHFDAETLSIHDKHLRDCLRALPPRHQLDASEHLEPMELHPIMSVQSARLVLHRHNLMPDCPSDIRIKAIDDCTSIARETVRVLRRCLPDPGKSQSVALVRSMQQSIVSAVSAFLCVHIWRCILFLCHRFDFTSALVCAQFGAIVGNARPINVACGRYLEFFLQELMARWRRNIRFDKDEDMIAYVSADLQGNLAQAWVWQDGVQEIEERVPRGSDDGHPNQQDASAFWSGWSDVLRNLEQLQHDVGHNVPRHTPPDSVSTADLDNMQSPTQADSPVTSGRLNIRDLI